MKENKFIAFIKESFSSKKGIEKLLLYVGATILVIIGLIWNIYSDTKLNVGSQWLFFGLLTGIAGSVFIYVGSTMNNFDVKITGLVLNFVGCALGIASIFVPMVYALNNKGINGMIIVFMIFNAIGAFAALGGTILQLLRYLSGDDE